MISNNWGSARAFFLLFITLTCNVCGQIPTMGPSALSDRNSGLLDAGEEFAERKCPDQWLDHFSGCVRFIVEPRLSFNNAMFACQSFGKGARLASVLTEDEHKWYNEQLLRLSSTIDPGEAFLTSGKRTADSTNEAPVFEWSAEEPPTIVNAFADVAWYSGYFTKPVEGRPSELLLPSRPNDVIAYTHDAKTATYKWILMAEEQSRPFICRVDEEDRPNLLVEPVPLTIGHSDASKPNVAPRIVTQPHLINYFLQSYATGQPTASENGEERTPPIQEIRLRCDAIGEPRPNYRWFKLSSGLSQDQASIIILRDEVIPGEGNFRHMSQVGGDLVLLDTGRTTQRAVSGQYVCQAANELGSVISEIGSISFASLPQFTKTSRQDVRPNNKAPISIACNAPTTAFPLRYTWFKNEHSQILDSGQQGKEHIFISDDGSLYFERTLSSDEGEYFCVINPREGHKRNEIIYDNMGQSSQSTRIRVGPTTEQREIKIFDGFPKLGTTSATGKSQALVGSNLRLECVAQYWDIGLSYSWTFMQPVAYQDEKTRQMRTEYVATGSLPNNARLLDNNRILLLMNATMSNSGRYRCTASAPKSNSKSEKMVTVNVLAAPYYPRRLRDMVVAPGATDVRMTCFVEGSPVLSVVWYKNSEPFFPDGTGRVTFSEDKRQVIFATIDEQNDPGVYECLATNSQGRAVDSAELRVIAMAPSFDNAPKIVNHLATEGSSYIIRCRPEASPNADITWSKEGGGGISSSNYIPPYNDLEIKSVSQSSQGAYVCTAKNDYGEAKYTSFLTVLPKTDLRIKPFVAEPIEIGSLHVLMCEATNSSRLDIQYEWWLNSRRINFVREHRYHLGARTKELPGQATGQSGNFKTWEEAAEESEWMECSPDADYWCSPGFLVIKSVGFEDEGNWTCIARTAVDSKAFSLMIEVAGPPYIPAGVTASSFNEIVTLRWLQPDDNHHEMLGYRVESMVTDVGIDSHFNWTLQRYVNFTEEQTIPSKDRTCQRTECSLKLPFLTAATTYVFRIIAENTAGYSEPSPLSQPIQTPPRPPTVVPVVLNACDNMTYGDIFELTPEALIYYEDSMKIIEESEEIFCGGGKVGTLQVLWNTLPVMLHNANQLNYTVKYRQQGANQWLQELNFPHPKSKATFVIGQGANKYYKPYEVEVGTRNIMGSGPQPPLAMIMSAEEIPQNAPVILQAWAHNESAITIEWEEVKDSRETVQGKLQGYRVFYWLGQGIETQREALRMTQFGQHNHGTIVGLRPDTYYEFKVQVFNGAGNSRPSGIYTLQTLRRALRKAPREVRVEPRSATSIHITWRGVQPAENEEPVEGYAVRLWRLGESVKMSTDYIAYLNTELTIYDLPTDIRYQLRVFGYSKAGEGKMSSPVIIFELSQDYLKVYAGIPMSANRLNQSSFVYLLAVSCLVYLIVDRKWL